MAADKVVLVPIVTKVLIISYNNKETLGKFLNFPIERPRKPHAFFKSVYLDDKIATRALEM